MAARSRAFELPEDVLSRERKTTKVARAVVIRGNGWYDNELDDKGPASLSNDLRLAGEELVCDRD